MYMYVEHYVDYQKCQKMQKSFLLLIVDPRLQTRLASTLELVPRLYFAIDSS